MFASSPMSVIEGVDCNVTEFFRFAMFCVHVFFCSLRNGRWVPPKNSLSLQLCYLAIMMELVYLYVTLIFVHYVMVIRLPRKNLQSSHFCCLTIVLELFCACFSHLKQFTKFTILLIDYHDGTIFSMFWQFLIFCLS